MDEGITFEEAKALALTTLREQYRPEFLGRFSGNIYCFQRLSFGVLERIIDKDFERINKLIDSRDIHITINPKTLHEILEDKYLAREGARSILGYIDRNITSGIADFVLGDEVITGVLEVKRDREKDKIYFEKYDADQD